MSYRDGKVTCDCGMVHDVHAMAAEQNRTAPGQEYCLGYMYRDGGGLPTICYLGTDRAACRAETERRLTVINQNRVGALRWRARVVWGVGQWTEELEVENG